MDRGEVDAISPTPSPERAEARCPHASTTADCCPAGSAAEPGLHRRLAGTGGTRPETPPHALSAAFAAIIASNPPISLLDCDTPNRSSLTIGHQMKDSSLLAHHPEGVDPPRHFAQASGVSSFSGTNSPGAALRIGAIDDHPAILRGVVSALATYLPVPATVVLADTVDALLDHLQPVDIVLLDLSLGDGSSPEDNVGRLRKHGLDVLLFTQEVQPRRVAAALAAGAKGVVGKGQDLEELADAVMVVAAGDVHLSQEWAAALESQSQRITPKLSQRELEALELYAAGLPMKSVAHRLNIGMDTVREYLLRVRAKYESSGRPANTKTDLYIRAVEDGYLPPPDVG